MNDYAETAKRFKEMRAARADRLKALNERMDKHDSTSDVIFRKYEGAVEAMEEGMKEMEREAEEMRNEFKEDDKGGQTDSTVTAFPPSGKTDTAA